MRGSGTPEWGLSQAQLSKGKISECARQSLLRECSTENWWESGQCTGYGGHVVFRLYSFQEDLLALALLLVFSITLLTCKQVYQQQNFFPKWKRSSEMTVNTNTRHYPFYSLFFAISKYICLCCISLCDYLPTYYWHTLDVPSSEWLGC